MKLLRLSLFLLLCVFAEKLLAQVTVSGAIVGNGTYTSLSATFPNGAFSQINNGVQTGANIIITITGNVTEPNASNVALIGGVWSTITIKPSGGSWTITGAPAANGMIIFNGADNVTIDGTGAVAGTNYLTIANTSASSTAMAIKLYNDATNNTIKYCNLWGRNAAAQSATDGGIVTIAGTTGSTGNDNNYIQNCDLGPDAAVLPYNLIKVYGSSFSNDFCQITNCNLHDWIDLTVGNNTCAIYLASTFVSTWTISGNKFYQSSTRDIVAGGANDFYGLRIEGGGGYTISNNIFGYNTSAGTGYMTFTDNIAGAHTSIDLYPISLSLNTTLSTISGNTISNIDFTTARSTNSGTTYSFVGIWLKAGKANITNNTIGSSSGTGSILIKQNIETGSPTSPFLPIVGILIGGGSSNTISNNTIGGITLSYTGSGAIGTYGGNPFSAIYSNNTGASAITGNTIGNSTANNITSGNTISGANVTGIKLTSAAGIANTITSNTIQNLNCSGANLGTGANASVIGIQNTSFSGPSDAISGNTISNLSNTATSGSPATDVRGMYVTGGSGGLATALVVQKNWIHSLSVSSSSSTAQVSGITIYTGGSTATLSNNMISLGSGISTGNVFYGINYLSSTITCYYNTVRILGTPSSGSGNSHAFYCATTNALVLKNNILINERTNSGSTGTHYAIKFNSIPTTYTGVANDLFTSGTGGVLGYIGSNKSSLALWAAATTPINQDDPAGTPPSISTSYTFTSTIDLHIVPTACNTNNAGTYIATVLDDYDGATRSVSTPDIGADEINYTVTWNGGTGNWNLATNWTPNTIPAIYSDVIISSGSVSMNADAYCHSITISGGANLSANIYKLTLDGTTCTNSFFVNNGATFNANTGTVQFDGANSVLSGYIGGTSATTFNNVILNTGITFPASPLQATISSGLQLNSGSYVNTNTPVYGSSSTLTYNTNGSYGIGKEWTSTSDGTAGSGRPNNVTIVNTALSMTTANRAMAGKLSINLSGQLILDATSGDLIIRGDWSDQGTFTPNSRAVFFTGTADQTITRVGGGTETFSYFIINKPNSGTYVKPDNGVGNLTDVTINGTAGDILQLLNLGSLDLNGRTVTLDGSNPAGAFNTYIKVYGDYTIINSSPLYTGKLEIKSSVNVNAPSNYLLSVANNSGTGTLTFNQNVWITIADGHVDFGYDGVDYLSYVQGTLEIKLGANVYPRSCYYTASPASTLRFANTVDYQVNNLDYTWAAGALYSGLPGIPYNVEINNTGTDVTINETRGVRNNITITSGTLTLTTGIGNFNVGGNWSRSGVTSAFTPNNNPVVLDGNADQSITCTANSNKETFYGLDISNNDITPEVTLSGSTSIQITNQLSLTSGIVTCGTGEVYVSNNATAAILYDPSDNSANSWVNGALRRAITTGAYAFPLGSSTLTNGDGYELALFDFATNSNVDNLLGRFTADATTTADETFSLTVSGTVIVDRLNAGYWNFKPYDAALALVASPSCTYNVALNERGHSNSAASPFYYAVIKRVDSADPTGAVWNQQCGTHVNATQSESGGTAYAERSDYSCNSFSDFSIGVGTFILPVELTTFTVSLIGENSLLEWNTQSEWNSNYFAIERSLDGIQFEEIGITNAAGSSTVPNNYFYTDYEVTELGVTKIYYRLRMVNLDQTFTYSPVRWVELQEQDVAASISVFPNPAHDNTSISLYAASEQSALLQLVDVSGKVFFEMTPDLKKGINFIEVDHLDKISAGLYFIHVICGRDFYSTKLVKE